MMRSFRENAKWIFYIVAFAFIGWLIFDLGLGLTGAKTGADVVLKIDGTEIHAQQWQAEVAAAQENYRQGGGGALNADQQKDLEDGVVDQLTQRVVLQEAYRRLGITVTDQEIIDAARTSPPP